MRSQFKKTIMELSTSDDRIVMILGDVSVYLFNEFKLKYPTRFYNMGICENTLVSVAGGLSSQGLIPVVHTIAPFVTERSFEQIKLDMCYNQFRGNIVSCGASFDYAWDGTTHYCYTDLAMLRLLPNMKVIQPGSKKELDVLLRSEYHKPQVTYFRLSDYPHSIEDIAPIECGKGVILKNNGANLTVMTAGPLLGNVLEAVRDLAVNLVYFHTIKPIDKELVSQFRNTKIIVVHDALGLYEAICEVPNLSVSFHGPGDSFYSWYGTVHHIRQKIGLDVQGIKELVQQNLQ
jgi:transketolase